MSHFGGGGGGLNFNTFLCFSEMNTDFFGYEDFFDILWGHHKTGLVLGVISMHFRVFSYCQCSLFRIRIFCGVC